MPAQLAVTARQVGGLPVNASECPPNYGAKDARRKSEPIDICGSTTGQLAIAARQVGGLPVNTSECPPNYGAKGARRDSDPTDIRGSKTGQTLPKERIKSRGLAESECLACKPTRVQHATWETAPSCGSTRLPSLQAWESTSSRVSARLPSACVPSPQEASLTSAKFEAPLTSNFPANIDGREKRAVVGSIGQMPKPLPKSPPSPLDAAVPSGCSSPSSKNESGRCSTPDLHDAEEELDEDVNLQRAIRMSLEFQQDEEELRAAIRASLEDNVEVRSLPSEVEVRSLPSEVSEASSVDARLETENEKAERSVTHRKRNSKSTSPRSLAQTFKPGQWLSDASISYVYSILIAGELPRFYRPAAGLKTEDVKFPDSILLIDPATAFWLALEDDPAEIEHAKAALNLDNRDILLCPITDNRNGSRADAGTHWSLLVCWRPRPHEPLRFIHYDSLDNGAGFATPNRRRAEELARRLGGRGEVTVGTCPRQMNNYDCGVYVLMVSQIIVEYSMNSSCDRHPIASMQTVWEELLGSITPEMAAWYRASNLERLL